MDNVARQRIVDSAIRLDRRLRLRYPHGLFSRALREGAAVFSVRPLISWSRLYRQEMRLL